MKKSIFIGVAAGIVMLIIGYIAGSLFPANLGKGKSILVSTKAPKLTSDADTFAYYYGYNVGQYITKDLDQLMMKDNFPAAKFLSGINTGISGTGDEVDQMTMQAFMQAFFAKKQVEMQVETEKKGQTNIEEGRAFLEKNKAEAGVVTTASGLQYQIIAQGSGDSPKATDTVTVHYKGTLLDGKVFDSSIDRGEPASFVVSEVIPGWTEALQLMKTGDKWKVFIPSDLAYGEQQRSELITPNSTLIFEVELLKITPAK